MDALSADARRGSETAACESPAIALKTFKCRESPDDWRARKGARSRAIAASGIASRATLRPMMRASSRITLFLRHFAEHRDGFDFDQQFGPAKLGLNAGGRRQGIQALLFVKRSALFVELSIVAIDVAQIARRADNVLPGNAFGCKQRRNILESAATLRAEIADVNGSSLFVNAGGAGNEQHDRAAAQLDAHAAREGTGFGVIVGLVEDAMIGDGALCHRFDDYILRGFFDDGHESLPKNSLAHILAKALAPVTEARAATLKLSQPQPIKQFSPALSFH